MGPPQGRAEGEENLPRPAAHTPLDAPQNPIGLLGTQGKTTNFHCSDNAESGGETQSLMTRQHDAEPGDPVGVGKHTRAPGAALGPAAAQPP